MTPTDTTASTPSTSSTARRRLGRLLLLATLAPLATTAAACSHTARQEGRLMASGRTVDQSRPLGAFHGVEVGPGFTAEVLAGEAFAVVLRTDEAFLPWVDTRVERGVLVVRMDERVGSRPRTPIAVTVRLPRLETLAVDGSQVTATGLGARTMKLTATGGSRVRADGVRGERLALEANEGSTVRLTGEVGQLRAEVFGGSQVEALQLQAVSAIVDVQPGARLEMPSVGNSAGRGQLSLSARPWGDFISSPAIVPAGPGRGRLYMR